MVKVFSYYNSEELLRFLTKNVNSVMHSDKFVSDKVER